jgi:hypothetical protein
MSPSAESLEFAPRPDALIAGMLCLMSCYVAHPVLLYAERVKENLGKLSDLTELFPSSGSSAAGCRSRWDAIVDDAQRRGEHGAAVRGCARYPIDSAAILAALDKRDPETLVGPALCLLTWIARDTPPPEATTRRRHARRLCECLVAHLGAIAAHPAVSLELRLTCGRARDRASPRSCG